MRAITTNQIIQATMYECHTPNVVFKGGTPLKIGFEKSRIRLFHVIFYKAISSPQCVLKNTPISQ